MLQLLPSSSYTVKVFPGGKEAGRAQASWRAHRQDSWPQLNRGIFSAICYHAQIINSWKSWAGNTAQKVAVHQSVSGEQLHLDSTCLFIYLFIFTFPFLVCPIQSHYLDPGIWDFFPPILSPILLQEERREGMAVWCCLTCYTTHLEINFLETSLGSLFVSKMLFLPRYYMWSSLELTPCLSENSSSNVSAISGSAWGVGGGEYTPLWGNNNCKFHT